MKKPIRKQLPEKDEIVVGMVSKVFPHGAFVRMEAYEKEGMVHISEISTKWIKNIRDHVQEGKKVVAKVLRIDMQKGHIDLSLKVINEDLKRKKLEEWKNEQKAEKILENVGRGLKKDINEAYQKAGFPLEDHYGTVYGGMEKAASEGDAALRAANVGEEWIAPILKIVSTSIQPKFVNIDGYLKLANSGPRGVEAVRNALLEAKKLEMPPKVKFSIQYTGAPLYRIKVTAPEYKTAEKVLKNLAETAIESNKKHKGIGEFHRQLKSE